MKTKLTAGDRYIIFDTVGKMLFIKESDGKTETENMVTCFSPEAALEKAAELIREKEAEGFTKDAPPQAGEPLSDPCEEWSESLSSLGPNRFFEEHFGYLAPEADELLHKAAVAVQAVTVEGGIEVQLTGGVKLIAGLPAKAGELTDLPAPARELFSRHRDIWLETEYDTVWNLGLGAGPAEGDNELTGTALAGTQVVWCMTSATGDSSYLFDKDGVLYNYELDGGLTGPVSETPGGILLLDLLSEMED